MKPLLLTTFLIISTFLCNAQESNTEKQQIKLYINAGTTAAHKFKVGTQGGLSLSKKRHLIKYQYMYKHEIYLGDASYGKTKRS
jgi:hypothetical protein